MCRPSPKVGRKWQVSTGGGTSPVWSRTGEEMYYRRDDTVMVASIEPHEGDSLSF